ncbi:hypothetical protein G7Y89_g14393 [Cudoniella acicularis]|uniref:Integral membrane protein n=1 Tax=Cudoniella acicularis TaxID=354080 RepID=A0A8H4R322_9HELO|nr:hypothetical protein G7Y89_g14393 [Cudoniella acicularis]
MPEAFPPFTNDDPPPEPSYLTVPIPTPGFQETIARPLSSGSTGIGATTGRPRSGSQRSGRSHGSSGTEVQDYGVMKNRERGRPSIRIRRQSSQIPAQVPQAQAQNAGVSGNGVGSGGASMGNGIGSTGSARGGRNRSSSAPQPPLHSDILASHSSGVIGMGNQRQMRGSVVIPHMPDVAEESFSPSTTPGASIPALVNETANIGVEEARSNSSGGGRRLRRARTNIANNIQAGRGPNGGEDDYEDGLVDMLDLIDPEVATLSTLTNLQNSLFIPDLGRYLNRRPTYNLTRRPSDTPLSPSPPLPSQQEKPIRKDRPRMQAQRTYSGATINTISSNVNDKYYAVLPHGVSLPGWSEEEKLELNDHVRHMLHSKRSRFKRSMRGFGQYFSKPLGFFVTLYATLITLFGLAWVLFLIGWINVGGRKDYIINVIDNVLVALFAIMGDGLAPFRAIDTYHMCFIAHYHHLTWRLRREKSLPKLQNHNDLPSVQPEDIESASAVNEEGKEDDEMVEYSVLNPMQQKRLAHHQKKFSRSHSFYKPHETYTHHAFPLRLLVAIVVLLDCHSLLQIALGTCTWAISYHVRPFALTTVILCCSITVNITAGVLISVGDRRTRKKDVRVKIERQELTEKAMRKVQRRRKREIERLGDGERGYCQ